LPFPERLGLRGAFLVAFDRNSDSQRLGMSAIALFLIAGIVPCRVRSPAREA
jgi:hypothetical protein